MNFGILTVVVKTDQKQVLIEVEASVEVPQEDGSESILIVFVWDALDTDEAVVLIWQAVQVTTWCNNYFCVLESEFEVTVDCFKEFALTRAHQNFSSIYILLINSRVLGHHEFL